ncbi:hypothetical protein Tco_0637577 [Tanacetum coccineum]
MFLESNLECAGGVEETKTVDWRMKSSVCIWVFGRTLRRRFLRTPMSMALEQVMAEEDNEDEVDDDVANLEDRRLGGTNYPVALGRQDGVTTKLKTANPNLDTSLLSVQEDVPKGLGTAERATSCDIPSSNLGSKSIIYT